MFTLPALPFASNALEPYIDTQTMDIHHDKHHAAYIKNLNDLVADKDEQDLEELLKTTDNPKIKNNGGGHYNHSFFWKILAPATGQHPEGKLLEALTSTFGDVSTFQDKFSSVALGRFGSGWAWLVGNSGKLDIVDTPNQDNPIMTGLRPILGLDVWEHSYYLKFQNRRADYITAFWNVVNWKQVEANFSGSV